jgi:putative membrane protein insertion efficiency factor
VSQQYDQHNDPNARRRSNRRRRRNDDGDVPEGPGILDNLPSCKSCGRPFRGCDNACDACDLFHLSVLRVFLLTAPTRAPRTHVSLPGRAGLAAIRGYQKWISHRLRTCCRHTPTCSNYGAAVVEKYGLFQGARLAGGRIARCTGDVPRGTPDPPP